MPGFISFRKSIRWLPEEATEPTQTVVLTGAKTGAFIDVRFFKESRELDWAFSGYRLNEGSNGTRFLHELDSRIVDAASVDDHGTNMVLPNRTTLEKGEMVNPATGVMTRYEEIWRDQHEESILIIRDLEESSWYARAGRWQLAIGRSISGDFWAWQACKEGQDDKWTVQHSTDGAEAQFLPNATKEWKHGLTVDWAGQSWLVLEAS
ncbi:hypothetical protein C8J56DRAFT_150322 [Mycena floridula]|nr:hypothetical protein C8J56DRAFT_150322 [Mycena floridula]